MAKKTKVNEEGTWIAMIGLVSSTLVVFVLMLLLIVPVETEKVVITNDDPKRYIKVSKIDQSYFMANFERFNSINSVSDKFISYLRDDLDKSKDYLIRLKYTPNKNVSRGTDYDRAYSIGKTAIQLLVKAKIPIEQIKLKIVYKAIKGKNTVLEIITQN